MAAMHPVGSGHQLPPHAHVREEPGEYVVELDVSDFTERELTVETVGRRVTVRGDQVETPEDGRRAFRLHERLEETFRLPPDAAACGVRAFYKRGTLELHAPRRSREPRRVPIEHAAHRINPDAEAC